MDMTTRILWAAVALPLSAYFFYLAWKDQREKNAQAEKERREIHDREVRLVEYVKVYREAAAFFYAHWLLDRQSASPLRDKLLERSEALLAPEVPVENLKSLLNSLRDTVNKEVFHKYEDDGRLGGSEDWKQGTPQ